MPAHALLTVNSHLVAGSVASFSCLWSTARQANTWLRSPRLCTGRYGQDVRGGPGLAELLRELARLDGLRWMRLLYCYPSYFTNELIDEIANNSKAWHFA